MQMMHAYAKTDTFLLVFFFEGLVKVIVNLIRNIVLFENCEDVAIGSLFKSKNETKEKILNKS